MWARHLDICLYFCILICICTFLCLPASHPLHLIPSSALLRPSLSLADLFFRRCSSVEPRNTPSSPSTYPRFLCCTLHTGNPSSFHVESSPRPVATLASRRISSLDIPERVVAPAHSAISRLYLLRLATDSRGRGYPDNTGAGEFRHSC